MKPKYEDLSLAGSATEGFLGLGRLGPALYAAGVHLDDVHVAIVSPGASAHKGLGCADDRTGPV